MLKRSLNIAALTLGISLATACASNGTAPTSLVAEAEKSIEIAKSSHTTNKSLALDNASDNLVKAKSAIEKEKYNEARELLKVSIAESEYAIAKADADKSVNAANQIEKSLQQLKKESMQ